MSRVEGGFSASGTRGTLARIQLSLKPLQNACFVKDVREVVATARPGYWRICARSIARGAHELPQCMHSNLRVIFIIGWKQWFEANATHLPTVGANETQRHLLSIFVKRRGDSVAGSGKHDGRASNARRGRKLGPRTNLHQLKTFDALTGSEALYFDGAAATVQQLAGRS